MILRRKSMTHIDQDKIMVTNNTKTLKHESTERKTININIYTLKQNLPKLACDMCQIFKGLDFSEPNSKPHKLLFLTKIIKNKRFSLL